MHLAARVATSVTAAAVLLLAGCGLLGPDDAGPARGGGDSRVSTADCSSQIRVEGRTYSSYSFTRTVAEEYVEAEVAECHDVGPKAAGSVFTEDPERVRTWTVHGYDPVDVLLVRHRHQSQGAGSFAVFIADSMARHDRDLVMRKLASPRR